MTRRELTRNTVTIPALGNPFTIVSHFRPLGWIEKGDLTDGYRRIRLICYGTPPRHRVSKASVKITKITPLGIAADSRLWSAIAAHPHTPQQPISRYRTLDRPFESIRALSL